MPYIKTFFAERNPLDSEDMLHIGATDKQFNDWIVKNNAKLEIISFQKENRPGLGEILTILYNSE